MTQQIADTILYNGEEYEMLGDSSHSLPMLNQFGMKPAPMNTGCYRGFIAEYMISRDSLYLTSLTVQDANDNYPQIGGVSPVLHPANFRQPMYANLHELMLISGSITIGKGIPNNWQHYPDIRSVHDFILVLKLTLQNGRLESVFDISEAAASIRAGLMKIYPSIDDPPDLRQLKRDWRSERMKKLMERSWRLKYSVDIE